MRIYSLHTVTDGKWEVSLRIREADDYRHDYVSRSDVRETISTHYDLSAEELAKVLLTQIHGCASVSVQLLCGPGVYMEKDGGM